MIHIANYEPDRIGGGWSFARNFTKVFPQADYDSATYYLIAGATTVERDKVIQAKKDGKKIIFRIDNAVRDSRNRGTGMSRMEDYCELADLIVYQSNWARRFLYPFTKKDGAVILNGVDTEIYNDDNRFSREDSYLYVRSSRDEGKQWIMAWYYFVNNRGTLSIVGKFSSENTQYNFDFYNNERFVFLGEQKTMAPIYKANEKFLYTYLNDACSNTLLEALASGCEIIDVYGMLQTGGAPEIMELRDLSLQRMCKEYESEINRL